VSGRELGRRPTSGGHRRPTRTYGSAGGGTLKGETPGAGPARNKAGRCRAEKGPESVRNAERARTRRLVASGASGCLAPGRRRRGENRKGGAVGRGQPRRRRRWCDQTLEGNRRSREDGPGKEISSGRSAGRRPHRSAERPRPERERETNTDASPVDSILCRPGRPQERWVIPGDRGSPLHRTAQTSEAAIPAHRRSFLFRWNRRVGQQFIGPRSAIQERTTRRSWNGR
jgi:hypothetical protein